MVKRVCMLGGVRGLADAPLLDDGWSRPLRKLVYVDCSSRLQYRNKSGINITETITPFSFIYVYVILSSYVICYFQGCVVEVMSPGAVNFM